MNNDKLVFCVIILCIVSPMLVGYVWPIDATSEQAWETGDPKDISNDAINTKLPIYVPYNDPFNNNQNVFDDKQYVNLPVQETANEGPVWSPRTFSIRTETVTTDASGHYGIHDISIWQNWASLGCKAVTIERTSDWNEIKQSLISAVLVVYYPETDKMYLRDVSGEFIPSDSKYLDFYGSANTEIELVYRTYTAYNYANLDAGFYIFNGNYSTWFNGYENKGANIIFNTVDSDLAEFIYIHDPLGYNDTTVSLWIDYGTIMMTLWADGVPYYVGALGSMSIYDKVLLTIDYDSATIALSGLRGMNSFIGDYTNAIRETIKADWQDPVIFRSFSISKNAGNHAAWYVADTLSAIAETDGSHNYQMELRDYTANGSCQLNVRNITLHGDKLAFMINTTYKLGTIANGNLSIEGVDGPISVPVNNMLIGLIGNKVYLNGYVLAEFPTINKVHIYFYDDWIMSLVYYPVSETTVPGFDWLPGSFGLDEHGYCIVGLIASAFTGLGASLYGRRSGSKMFMVTFVSGVIGAVYLLILMGGL